jgi:putative transposase
VSAFIDEHRARFGVEPICRTLDVSASAYYQRATGERSDRMLEDDRLLARIEDLHAVNYYAYGYRRMWKAMLRAGETCGRDRVKRLMRADGIVGAKRRGKPWPTTTPDPTARRPPDLVDRDFTATRPDALWVADFCYLRCWEGAVFFSFVLDVFSRRIVGWQFASHMRTDLVLDALRMALAHVTAAPTSNSSIIPTPVRNTPASTSSRSSTTTPCWRRSARSATPMTVMIVKPPCWFDSCLRLTSCPGC